MDTKSKNLIEEMKMNTLFLQRTLLAATLTTVCVASLHPATALAALSSITKAAKPVQLQQAYTWHDGKTKRTAWLDPQLLAEFKSGKRITPDKVVSHAGNASETPTIKSHYPQASAVGRVNGGVQLWQMGAGTTSDQAAQTLIAKPAAGAASTNYSPILRDSASSAGRMRALPGGVIVYLNPEWDRAAVDAWALGKQLEIVNKLAIGKNVYLIKTPAGLETLSIANSLMQSGEVVAATPNWWQEVTTK